MLSSMLGMDVTLSMHMHTLQYVRFCMYARLCIAINFTLCLVCIISRLTIVSREAKKKQAVRDEQVSYLHVAPL